MIDSSTRRARLDMFGFKKKQPLVFGTLQEVLLELTSREWTNVVTQSSKLENKRPPHLRPIPSKSPELRELFLKCLAFHCAALYLTALRTLDQQESSYVTAGTVQEICLSLHKYLGTGCDRTALQNRVLSRVSELTSLQEFAPDLPEDAFLENFENSTMGQHSLTTIGLLNLSKYSPEATIVILAGRATVIAAIEADVYQAALKHSLPGIRLSRAFPG
jgi:hypothetical protein